MNSIMMGSPREAAITKVVATPNRPTPAASPSSPSMRFMALITPTIHSRVKTRLSGPRLNVPMKGRDRMSILKAGPVQRAGDGELGQELLARARAANVVVQTEAQMATPPSRKAMARASWRRTDPAHAAGFDQQGQERGVEAGRDGDAAQARDGPAVDLAGRHVVVEQAVLEGKAPHHRGQEA
jgi:hypothetical protein